MNRLLDSLIRQRRNCSARDDGATCRYACKRCSRYRAWCRREGKTPN
jgi:hypothetical protein